MLSSNQTTRLRSIYLRLGLRSGLLIGLALAVGVWASPAILLRTTHLRLLYPPLVLGSLLLLLLGGLGGWLAARFENAMTCGIVWIVAAVLMTLVIGHLPYEGQTVVIWLVDRRFWGLPIYAINESAQIAQWLAGFFIVLLMAFLGFTQNYRLEGLLSEVDVRGRLNGYGWAKLLLPLPLVLIAGLIADNIVNSSLRDAPQLVHRVFQTGLSYDGDLFELSRREGVNYNAISAIRDQLSEDYSLFIGEAEAGTGTVLVVAHFDNGTWVNCWVIGGNLSSCYDASPPYMQGFAALLTDGETPPDCRACRLQVSYEQRNWLLSKGGYLDGAPRITRLAQWGSYVLLRTQSPDGEYAMECFFQGIRQVRLVECQEVEGAKGEATTPESISEPIKVDEPTLKGPLALYAPAMRPAFVQDLTAVGPLSQYRIEVTVDAPAGAGQARVSGRETINYVNTTPVSQDVIYLRLFPNLPSYGGEMTVSNLRVGEEMVTGDLKVRGTALRVPLTASLPPGEETVIALDFDVVVPRVVPEQGYGQFIYDQDVMALANFFPLIPAYDEENCARFGNCDAGWNIEYAPAYGDAVFSETALFEVRVTTPAEWTVVASGSTIEQEPGPQDTVTWHIVSGPMRDFNLVLSPRFEVATQKVEDITINSYYLPEDAEGGEWVLRWTEDALAFFNQHFGPYPFAEFDVVATPTTAGGIEYPGLIVMPIRNYDQTAGSPFEWATVHEVAHQWWYSLVGNDQQDEPWLDEALVQYSTALYYELDAGWDGAVRTVFEDSYERVENTEEDDWISRPVAAYTSSNYGPVVYGKGPLFFHALRHKVGYKAFTAFLQTYFDTYRYEVASGPDLLALAEAVSEQDLTELYREWFGEMVQDE
jgi:hypothetical protein